MKNRNAITLGLMISSVCLLVLLEGLWLYRSYEKEYFDLRRDANLYLRATLGEIRDSLLLRNIEPMGSDTLFGGRVPSGKDTIVHGITRIETSIHSRIDGRPDSSIRFFISTPSDCVRSDVVKPLIARIAQLKTRVGSDRMFVIRVNEDTVAGARVKARYKEKLESQGVRLPVLVNVEPEFPEAEPVHALRKKGRIFRMNASAEAEPEIFASSLKTEAAPFNPAYRYTATLGGIRPYLISEITPELLFVFLVTVLTCGAFVLVYRNLRRQQRLVQAKNDFISNVTHELKTPVATVSVALEALKNFNALDKRELAQEYLEIALKELERLSSITDNILRISILENNPGGIAFNEVDIRTLLDSAISAVKLQADSRGGVITVVSEGEEFSIQGAHNHLFNAFTNLLDNAIKYSTDKPMISVNVTASPETVCVSIKDNGIGIDPTFHTRIFEKFFRVPEGDVHNIKGHGLGLNYVHSVVSLHRGTININSEQGKGSEFILTFYRKSIPG